jgi:hypothetical protein
MAKFNKELHEALENLDGTEFTRGETVGRTLYNFNTKHVDVTVTFSLTPSTAVVVVKDAEGETVAANQDGTYTLHERTYTYTASNAGYLTKTEELIISQADITTGTKTVNVSLTAICRTTFSAKDSVTEEAITGFTLIVEKGEDIIVPNTAGGLVYDLPAATYAYTISKEGYVTQTDVELVIASGDVTTGTKAVVVSLVANE